MADFPYEFPFYFNDIIMALNKNIRAETLLNGSTLKLIDDSIYDSTTPKSLFSNRRVRITYSDGTFIERDFPYTNTNNNQVDTIEYENIFSKDSIISIRVQFIYQNPSTPTEEFIFNYLSIIFSLKCRSNLANNICGCDDCNDELSILCKLDSYLDSAKYSALYGDEIKSQKFLDSCTEICNSLKNQNCKDC